MWIQLHCFDEIRAEVQANTGEDACHGKILQYIIIIVSTENSASCSWANVCLLRSLCLITSHRAVYCSPPEQRSPSAAFQGGKTKALLYENNLSLLKQCLSRKMAKMLFQKNYVSEIKNAAVCRSAAARGEPFTAGKRSCAASVA